MARDLDAVLARFGSWSGVDVVGSTRPAAGFSTQTLVVDLAAGERVVLKLPPEGEGIFPAYDFGAQARVQEAVAAAGVPAPAPATAVDDPGVLGCPFLVMPFVAGHVIDGVPLLDPWLAAATPEANARVHETYVDTVAAVHRVDGSATGVPARDNEAELAHWRSYLDWYGEGAVLAPALADALAWCEANRPATEPAPALLWGDVRLGNGVWADDRRLLAVLDWEMATIGAPEHDLGWTLALEGLQATLFGRSVPGFLDRDGVVARYEAAAGRSVHDLDWYETFALVRSTAVMTRVTFLQERAGEPTMLPLAANPVLDLLTRRLEATT